MGWFYASSGNWTPRELRINQVYSKIHFLALCLSCSLTTPISSHPAPVPTLSLNTKSIYYFILSALLRSFLFSKLAFSGSNTVSLDGGRNISVETVGVDMRPAHFSRQTWWGQGLLCHYAVRTIVYSDIFAYQCHILPSPHIFKLVIYSQAPARTNEQDITFKVSSNKTLLCSLSSTAPTATSLNMPPSIINPAN